MISSAARCDHSIRGRRGLAQAIKRGEVYVQVHSTWYPKGVAHGQLTSAAGDEREEKGSSAFVREMRYLMDQIFDLVGQLP